MNYKSPIYLEVIAWGAMIACLVLPLFYYSQLPEQIPSHFNAKGQADAYGNKASIFVLPIIGAAVFLLLHFLSRYKNLKPNTTKKLSPTQEAQVLIINRKLLNALKIIISFAFLYITYSIIQTALGNANGLGSYFIYIFIGTVFGIIAYFVMQSLKASK